MTAQTRRVEDAQRHDERRTADDAPRPGIGADDRSFPVSRRRLTAELVSVTVAAWAIAAFVYRIWDASLRLPLYPTTSDTTLVASMVKTITERGFYLTTPRLGAPFGQQFYDFPHGGETFQMLVLRGISLFTHDVGLIMNVYYLAGFGVVAAVMFLVLRHLRFGPMIAAVVALLYAFLPYHFAHEQLHLFRSTYYSAPLAGLLLMWAQCWRARFLHQPDAPTGWRVRSNVRWSRVDAALFVCVIIGGTETMTTSFTMVLLATSALITAIRYREPQRLVVSGLFVATLAATFLVLSIPTLAYFLAHGTNDVAAQRVVTESERYSLKLSRMVLPQANHRVGLLADLGHHSQSGSLVVSEGGQYLGLLGLAGFVVAMYGVMANGLGRRRAQHRELRQAHDRGALWEHGGMFTVLALLFGSVGGLAVLVAMAGLSQVRVWNRISLTISFFALVLVATGCEHVARFESSKARLRRPALAIMAVGLLAFGLSDSIPTLHFRYRQVEQAWNSDRAFVGAIETAMPRGTAIFQLPVLPFPETRPPGRMHDYDPFRGYLADNGTLRWSYGALKGRPGADWQVRLQDRVGPTGALPALLGLGFTGLWVDTAGYRRGNDDMDDIRHEIGDEPLRSPDGRFLFYDLRAYKRRIKMSDAELQATAVRLLGVQPSG